MADLPEPLTPPACDLRKYPFMPLELRRLLTSETWILGTGEERAAAIALWLESWHQVPAASLPDDDRMLEHLSQSKKWKGVRAHVLRGWIKCSDGRLYHSTVAEKALEVWIDKLMSSVSGSAGNAKRWGTEVDTDVVEAQIVDAAARLRAIAPRSEILSKTKVRNIVSRSHPDDENIAPRLGSRSPPDQKCIAVESPPDEKSIRSDRNREGEGKEKDSKPPNPLPPAIAGEGYGQLTGGLFGPAEVKGGARRKATPAASLATLPPWLPPESWERWEAFRKRKSAKAWTEDARSLSLRTLTKLREAGHDPTAVIDQSIERGYAGLFELKGAQRKPANQHGNFESQDYHAGVSADGSF